MNITINRAWRRRIVLAASGAVLLATTAAGCGSSHESGTDPGGVQGTKRQVIQFATGFRNAEVQCWGTTAVFSGSHGSEINDVPGSIAISPNDPYCRGQVAPTQGQG